MYFTSQVQLHRDLHPPAGEQYLCLWELVLLYSALFHTQDEQMPQRKGMMDLGNLWD